VTISVKLDLSGFRRVRQGEAEAIDRGVTRAANYVADLAQQLAPEDTGELKASRHVAPGPEAGTAVVSFGRGLPDKRAIYQEYGTSRMAAQPYLTPALRQVDLAAEIAAELQALIR